MILLTAIVSLLSSFSFHSNMPRIELESTLLVLPFENICQLLTYMTAMLQTNQQVEMCVKAILFIIRLYEVGTREEKLRISKRQIP